MSHESFTPSCSFEYMSSLSRKSTLRPSSKRSWKEKESKNSEVKRAELTRLEQEQMLEDEIAVRLIRGLHLPSIIPLDSVKTEFHDLDGLKWTRPLPQPRRRRNGLLTKSALPRIPIVPKRSHQPAIRYEYVPCSYPPYTRRVAVTPRTTDEIPPGTFSHEELGIIAFRLSKEIKFPNVRLDNQTIAEAAFASLP